MANDDPEKTFSDLLGESLGKVNKLQQNRRAPYRSAPSTQPLQRLKDENQVLQELMSASDETSSFESGDELTYLREGHSRHLLKKLRRGHYSIQDELDLHGHIASEAKIETHRFINDCALDKVRAVRIVHGKGLNSPDKKPVIKNHLLGWLTKNKHVIAVCSSPSNDGGTGSVYVLLD